MASVESDIKKTEPELQFTQEEPLSDVVLVVEGKRLHTSKSLLGFASPVFKCMFTSEFKEKDQNEVTLPGKDAKTIDEMLRFLHPAMDKDLIHGEDSAFRLLPVAEEYQLFLLRDKCEETLIVQAEKLLKDFESMRDPYYTTTYKTKFKRYEDFNITYLQTSDRYSLKNLLNCVAKQCAKSSNLVKNIRQNQELTTEIKLKIMEERLDIIDKPQNE